MQSTPRWRFEVEQVFSITGRGTVAVGRMHGIMHNGEPAILDVDGTTRRLDRVGVDILCGRRDDDRPNSVGLVLPGLDKSEVPRGAVIYAVEDSPGMGTPPGSERPRSSRWARRGSTLW